MYIILAKNKPLGIVLFPIAFVSKCKFANRNDFYIQKYKNKNIDWHTCPDFIKFMKTYKNELQNVLLYELPDDITDYMILDSDCGETCYYVRNGKIFEVDNSQIRGDLSID